MEELLESIFQAVQSLSSSSTPPQQRNEARELLERFKNVDNSDEIFNSARCVLNNVIGRVADESLMDHCFIYGLQLLKEAFVRDWAKKPEQAQGEIVSWVLPLLMEPQLLRSSAIVSLCGQILSIAARPCWPHNWPSLLPEVLNGNNTASQRAVGISLLCELCTDVTAADSVVTVQQRRKLVKGLTDAVVDLVGFIQSSVEQVVQHIDREWTARVLLKSGVELIGLLAQAVGPRSLLEMGIDATLIQIVTNNAALRVPALNSLMSICEQLGIKKGADAACEVLAVEHLSRLFNTLGSFADEAKRIAHGDGEGLRELDGDLERTVQALAGCIHALFNTTLPYLIQRNRLALLHDSLGCLLRGAVCLTGVPNLEVVTKAVETLYNACKAAAPHAYAQRTLQASDDSLRWLQLPVMLPALCSATLFVPPPVMCDPDAFGSTIPLSQLVKGWGLGHVVVLGNNEFHAYVYGVHSAGPVAASERFLSRMLGAWLRSQDESPAGDEKTTAEMEVSFVSEAQKLRQFALQTIMALSQAGPSTAFPCLQTLHEMAKRLHEHSGVLPCIPPELGNQTSRVRTAVAMAPRSLVFCSVFYFLQSCLGASMWQTSNAATKDSKHLPWHVALSQQVLAGSLIDNSSGPLPDELGLLDESMQSSTREFLRQMFITLQLLMTALPSGLVESTQLLQSSNARAQTYVSIYLESQRLQAVASVSAASGASPSFASFVISQCFELAECPSEVEQLLGEPIDSKLTVQKLRSDALQCVQRVLREAPLEAISVADMNGLIVKLSGLQASPLFRQGGSHQQGGVLQATLVESVKRAARQLGDSMELTRVIGRLAWPNAAFLVSHNANVASLESILSVQEFAAVPRGGPLAEALTDTSSVADLARVWVNVALLPADDPRSPRQCILALQSLADIVVAGDPPSVLSAAEEGSANSAASNKAATVAVPQPHPLAPLLEIIFVPVLRLCVRLAWLACPEMLNHSAQSAGDLGTSPTAAAAIRALCLSGEELGLFLPSKEEWPSPMQNEQDVNTRRLFPSGQVDTTLHDRIMGARRQLHVLRASANRLLAACGVWMANYAGALDVAVRELMQAGVPWDAIPTGPLTDFTANAFTGLFASPSALVLSPYPVDYFLSCLALPYLQAMVGRLGIEYQLVISLMNLPISGDRSLALEFRLARANALGKALAQALSGILASSKVSSFSKRDLELANSTPLPPPATLAAVYLRILHSKEHLTQSFMSVLCDLLRVAPHDETQRHALLGLRAWASMVVATGNSHMATLEKGAAILVGLTEKFVASTLRMSALALPVSWCEQGGSKRTEVYLQEENWLVDAHVCLDELINVPYKLYAARVEKSKRLSIGAGTLETEGKELVATLKQFAPVAPVAWMNALAISVASEDRDKLDRRRIVRGLIAIATPWLPEKTRGAAVSAVERALGEIQNVKGAKRLNGKLGGT